MEIFFEKTNTTQNIKLSKPKSLKEILKELNVNINSVILVKNDEICLEECVVLDTDRVKLLSVVSGG